MSDDAEAVLAANERFYRAFESLTLAEMEAVWAHGPHVGCIHPGWPALSGWEAVRESWATIFRNTREVRFTLTDVRVEVRGDVGWVLCTEHVLSEARGQLTVTAILATNIFERQGAGWRLVHHHASHVLGGPDVPPGETA